MRGSDSQAGSMFSYVSLEARVPRDHPLRLMRRMVDEALEGLSPRFEAIYAKRLGRPSIPPERLLRALLLQVLYSIRSERQLMEQLDYNLLYRWFVGLGMDDGVWAPTVFTKNRDRLFAGGIHESFFSAVLSQAEHKQVLSSEHFSVDGTLIEAWASQKSFARKGDRARSDDDDPGNPTVRFHGERRSNQTHASTTDPDARLAGRRGKESKLAYQGHVLTENRNGLVVQARLTQATGFAERDAALEMVAAIPGRHRATLAADRGYDTRGFVASVRSFGVTPHVAQNTTNRRSAIDGRTTRHASYAASQRVRKRVEEVFGWMKTVGLMRKTRHRGVERVRWTFVFTAAAYNLVRLRNLEMAR
ncbi:MAG: IS5 family transposase [Pseudomonadales bacterium]